MATDDEINHLRRLRAEVLKRRRELEVQAARFGAHVPAEIAIELRETEESLTRIDAKLLQPIVPQAVQDATGPEAAILVLRQQVSHLADQINTAMRLWTAEIIGMRDETARYRAEQEHKHAAGRRIQLALLAIDVALFVFVLWRLG